MSIDSYDSRQTLEKLKNQNQKLKREVRELTGQLNQLIEKRKNDKPAVKTVDTIVRGSYTSGNWGYKPILFRRERTIKGDRKCQQNIGYLSERP